MGYKYKPNKAVAKRVKLTKTGKIKRNHGYRSHLMSARPANKRRKLRRRAILSESLARNLRRLLGKPGIHPNKVRHERELEAAAKEKAA